MTDHIKQIREALAAGPTPGEWSVPHLSRDDVACNCASVLCESYCGAICTIHADDGRSIQDGGGDNPKLPEAKANGMLIAACNPAAITELLARLDAAEADAARYNAITTYLLGPRTDLDDAIIACKSKKEIDAVLDAAIAQEVKV